MVVDAKTDKVLGIHLVGPEVAEILQVHHLPSLRKPCEMTGLPVNICPLLITSLISAFNCKYLSKLVWDCCWGGVAIQELCIEFAVRESQALMHCAGLCCSHEGWHHKDAVG